MTCWRASRAVLVAACAACSGSPTQGADAGGTDSGTRQDAGNGYVDGGLLWFADCPLGTVSPGAISVAKISSGLVALVGLPDSGSLVERYLGQGCALTKDSAYQSSTGAIVFAGNQLVADSRDHLYLPAAGQLSAELDADGGTVQLYTLGSTQLAVSGDGLTLYTSFVGGPARSTRADTAAGFALDHTFNSTIPFVGGLALVGSAPLAGGTLNPGGSGPFQIYALSPTGSVSATYGSSNPNSPDGFCNVADVKACGPDGGFCALDYNCWKFSQFTAAGTYRAGFTFPDARQPLSVTPAGAGQMYLLHSVPGSANSAQLGIVSGVQ
jgi:hypothetical protein